MKKDQVYNENVKDRLIEALQIPEIDFSRYQTDLYVRYTKERMDWLKANYIFPTNLTTFTSQIDNRLWIEIPFAAWNEKYTKDHPAHDEHR